MRREAMRLSPRHRWWFYGIFTLLFATGAAWQALHTFEPSERGFDSSNHATQATLLELHGAAAMGFLILFGTLIPLHFRRGWVARLNRLSGSLAIAVSTLLILTGYALYYVGSEQLRSATSFLHVAFGLGAPGLLLLHIWTGRRARRLQESSDLPTHYL